MVELFNKITEQLKSQNVVSEAFTFVDSTSAISKLSIWKERDKIFHWLIYPEILKKLQIKKK